MAASNTPPTGGESGEDRGDITPAEREAFKQRADELGRRLETAKGQGPSSAKAGAKAGSNSANSDALGKAMRISTELIGGVLVGCGLGWLLDQAFGTWPAFFIVMFLAGSAAGMINVVRAGTAMRSGPSNPKAGPTVRDDPEED